MKKIYIKPPLARHYLNNGVFRVNNGHNIFWNLDKELAQKGTIVQTWDMDRNGDGDLYIYSDAPYPWELQVWKKTIATRERNILFCFESPIVNPFSHSDIVHRFFKRVYTWDDDLVDNEKYFKFFIPQLSEGLDTKPVDFREKKLLIFINAKKDVPLLLSMLSPYRKNLYKERFLALDYFTRCIPHDFEFYGKDWDKPIAWDIREHIFGPKLYSTCRGELKTNKIATLSNYKFCLCFENAVAPGYITEKIFDCFKARCVPIYWGAPDITEFINKGCFIDFRGFMDYKKLLQYLRNISEKNYNTYLEAVEEFLHSQDTRSKWFGDVFKRVLLEILYE